MFMMCKNTITELVVPNCRIENFAENRVTAYIAGA
jgi:hypothetical protein